MGCLNLLPIGGIIVNGVVVRHVHCLHRFWFNRDHVDRPDEPGKYNTSMCGFISAIDHFDTREFGISMKEAQQLDPSSRLILEVAHLVRAAQFWIAFKPTDLQVPIGSLRLWN